MTEAEHPSSSSRDPAPPASPGEVAARDEFVARVQHRLNNPLAALLVETQLLAMDDSLGASQREAAGRIDELVRRVIAIVRDLPASAETTGGGREGTPRMATDPRSE